MSSTHELKSLETRLKALKSELATVTKSKADIDAQERSLAAQVKSLENQIKTLTGKTVVVSEHAIVRYMERVHGIDLDQIKNEIVGRDHKTLKLPSGQYKTNGHKFRVKNGVVVTVITDDKER